MALDVALKATSFFLKSNSSSYSLIRFFGGEPLLEFPLIKKITTAVKKKTKKIRFDLTTNGTLLNTAIVDFLTDNKEIGLWWSPHRISPGVKKNLLRKLPNLGINMLITSHNVKYFAEDFLRFTCNGFKKFNFLPAYFCAWKEENLQILAHEFDVVASHIKTFSQRGQSLEVKNIKAYAATPLFNTGLVVDCNGDIFHNNIILSKYFAHLRPEFKIGHVDHTNKIDLKRTPDFYFLFEKILNANVFKSTIRVDHLLTRFVALLEN